MTTHVPSSDAPDDGAGTPGSREQAGPRAAARHQVAVPSVMDEIIAVVPRISEFYGIVIEMYYGDHPPPHFHAPYGGDSAKIEIAGGEVIAGSLPSRALRLVREWIDQHRDELDANWERAMHHQKPQAIDPLR